MKKGKKKDVLTLIEGDIVNAKLINTFRGLGIDADMYLTDSSEVIFRMLKIQNPEEELLEGYFELLRLGDRIDFSNSRHEARKLAKRIYSLICQDSC
ncbi:MAG: hypothetical protein K0S23_1225 [Fluviicola sp.]|jgi:hypothetical protein|uniref:hypothetical protein n=1 Tax=Fluviicola sp. TaxID=1917219 RepID=UPI00261BF0BA|nr:hypothetical protein [Fluviicola sp.]MDF3026918.1 hypothetical protein [Fluviicola sp.]